ncbi:MAG: helix-turn-helix domain-containing protein [Sporolactobacillus sp.]
MAYSKSSTKHRTFTHLNAYQRGQIQVLHQEQRSSREIDREVGCSHQTVLDELHREDNHPRSASIIDAFRFILRRPFKPTMNATAVIVGGDTNRKLLQISSFTPKIRSCPQTGSPDAVCGATN